MDKPTMFEPSTVTPDIDILPAYFPIPGLGIIPVNSFVIRAAEPVLVDTGLVLPGDEFMEKLSSVIDPADLCWLWLTHTDQDHIGNLWQVLEKAPKLRIITTFLGTGKMSLYHPLPMDRVHLLNPGQSIGVGDRMLTAIRPPTFDAPETTGFYDPKSAALFSADCFGALMTDPVESAEKIGASELKSGLSRWATVDSPWLHMADKGLFEKTLEGVRRLSRKIIMSSHLPPASDMTGELLVVVREREIGTMEQILATPTRPLELLLGKMVPLLVLCYMILGIILGLGVYWFGVEFQGNIGLYLCLALPFILASLGLGFLICTVAKNQRQAQQLSTVVMLFSMLLTGLVYPRNTMPLIPRLIRNFLPLTYFIRISRGIILKGVGMIDLWPDVLVLVIYSVVVMGIASLNFKKRLD